MTLTKRENVSFLRLPVIFKISYFTYWNSIAKTAKKNVHKDIKYLKLVLFSFS